MPARSNPTNILAGVMVFVSLTMSLLSRFVTYRTLYTGIARGYGFLQFMTGDVLTIIWLLLFVATGICLLLGSRVGTGVCFFIFGGINLIWLFQDLSIGFSNSSLGSLLQSVPLALLVLGAVILTGLFCMVPGKFPQTKVIGFLPAILYLATILFSLIGMLLYVYHSGKFGPAFLRFLFQVLRAVACSVALKLTCRWALEGAVQGPMVSQAPGGVGAYPFPAVGPASVSDPTPTPGTNPVSTSGTDSSTWQCGGCGSVNGYGRFCPRCGAPKPF